MAERKHTRLFVASVGLTAALSVMSGLAPVTAASPMPLPPTACPAGAALPPGTIATIAGMGTPGSSGDGGPAIDAPVSTHYGTVAVDADGNVYFYDQGGSVRRIGTDGMITSFTGPATGAHYRGPATGIAFDTHGGLLLGDWGAHRIWKVDADGAATPFAGTGTQGLDADGPALDADITLTQVAVGPHGDVYFDGGPGFATIDPDGILHPFAGTGEAGFSGDGGPATLAQLSDEVVAVAAAPAGDVYLADADNHRIRRVDADGIDHDGGRHRRAG